MVGCRGASPQAAHALSLGPASCSRLYRAVKQHVKPRCMAYNTCSMAFVCCDHHPHLTKDRSNLWLVFSSLLHLICFCLTTCAHDDSADYAFTPNNYSSL